MKEIACDLTSCKRWGNAGLGFFTSFCSKSSGMKGFGAGKWRPSFLASEIASSGLPELRPTKTKGCKLRNVIQRIQCRWNSETIRIWFNHSPGCLYSKNFPSSFSKLLVFPALQWINCRYKNASQQQFDQVNSSHTLNCLKLHRRIVAGVMFSTSFFQGFAFNRTTKLQPNQGPKQQRTTKHPAWWVTRTLVKVRRFTMSCDAFASKSLVQLVETWFKLMNCTASSAKVHKSAPDLWALQRVDGPQLRSWNPSNDQTVKSIRFIFACL